MGKGQMILFIFFSFLCSAFSHPFFSSFSCVCACLCVCLCVCAREFWTKQRKEGNGFSGMTWEKP